MFLREMNVFSYLSQESRSARTAQFSQFACVSSDFTAKIENSSQIFLIDTVSSLSRMRARMFAEFFLVNLITAVVVVL